MLRVLPLAPAALVALGDLEEAPAVAALEFAGLGTCAPLAPRAPQCTLALLGAMQAVVGLSAAPFAVHQPLILARHPLPLELALAAPLGAKTVAMAHMCAPRPPRTGWHGE